MKEYNNESNCWLLLTPKWTDDGLFKFVISYFCAASRPGLTRLHSAASATRIYVWRQLWMKIWFVSSELHSIIQARSEVERGRLLLGVVNRNRESIIDLFQWLFNSRSAISRYIYWRIVLINCGHLPGKWCFERRKYWMYRGYSKVTVAQRPVFGGKQKVLAITVFIKFRLIWPRFDWTLKLASLLGKDALAISN